MRSVIAIALVLAPITLPLHVHCASANGAPAVYRCEVDGVPTFSDRPCSPDAVPHRIGADLVSTYAPPVVTARPPSTNAGTRQRREAAEPDVTKQREACERMKQRLKDVRSRYRAGYSASEGERLKARETSLKAQLRSSRCR